MKRLILLLPLLLTACLQQGGGSSAAIEAAPAAGLQPAQPVATPIPAAVTPATAPEVEAALVGTFVQQGNANNSISFSGRNITYSTAGTTSTTHTKCINAGSLICGVPTTCTWTASSMLVASSGGSLNMYMSVVSSNSASGSPLTSITNCMYPTASTTAATVRFTSPTCVEFSFHMSTTPLPVYCK